MDHAAGPQPAHGPRRTGRPGQVHDPRPGTELHRRVRRGPRRHRDPDRARQRADAPDERDRRTLDRGMPPRAAGPSPRLEPGSSAADPARVRDPPQPAPAAPLPARRRAAEAAARTGRSRPVPRPKTHSRRWPDQRISPGRMTWTRFSARTVSWPRKVSVRPAAADASPRTPLRYGLPLPVRPGWLLAPDWIVRGDSFAQDTRRPGVGKTAMFSPISAMITWAAGAPMPVISSSRATTGG